MGYYSNILTDSAILMTTQDDKVIAVEEISCRIDKKSLYTESVIKAGDLIKKEGSQYRVTKVEPYYPVCQGFCVFNEALLEAMTNES